MRSFSIFSFSAHAWCFLLALALPVPAGAVELAVGDPPQDGALFRLTGEYRLQGTFLSEFAVDAEGTSFGQGKVLDQRLRIGGEIRAGTLLLGAEGDFFSGQFAGDTWDPAVTLDERRRDTLSLTGADAFAARRLSLGLSWPGISVDAGLMTSRWGLGMVANDGAQEVQFGRTDFGDRVVRLRVTGQPGRLRQGTEEPDAFRVIGSFDWVVADDLARFDRGQLAFQGVLALLWNRPGVDALGVYAVMRHQLEADRERQTNINVLDVYGDRFLPVSDGAFTLRMAAEGALVTGATDRSLTYQGKVGLGIVSGGATGLVQLQRADKKGAVMVRAGFASGDGNADDGTSTDFTFDRDFDVGSVLFHTVMSGIEAGTYGLLTDPQYSGQPPDGVDAVLTEGAFRRAIFVQPVAEFSPLPWLRLRGGLLFASSASLFSQPFYTARAGGDPRNHLNQAPEGRHLGTELDWSVTVGGVPKGNPQAPRFEFLAQGGHLIRGPAMVGEGAAAIHQVMLTGRMKW